jgi:hypothetical protein
MMHKFDDNIPARSFDNFQVITLQIKYNVRLCMLHNSRDMNEYFTSCSL